jgi:hypothetical protein
MKAKEDNVQALTGAVFGFKTNKHRDIDGLILDQGEKKVEVKFPPHTARFVQDIAKPNDSVRVTVKEKPHGLHKGLRHEHPPKFHLVSIENTTSTKQFSVEACEPPHPAETGNLESFVIKKPEFTTGGKHKEITGVLFEGKYFHLHPEEYELSEKALKAAAKLRVKAKKRREDAGFVNDKGYSVYHTHSLEIDQS